MYLLYILIKLKKLILFSFIFVFLSNNLLANTKTLVVTVVQSGGNKFSIDGVIAPTLSLVEGNTYIFDVSHPSNSGHPLRFKDASGNSYSTGVTLNGTSGQSGATVVIAVPLKGAGVARYHCAVHGNGMGNAIFNLLGNDPPVLTATGKNMQAMDWIRVRDYLSYTDSNGDTITKYQVQADSGTQNFWASEDSYSPAEPINMSGGNYEISANAWNKLVICGNKVTDGTTQETFKIRAYDGRDWSSWVNWTVAGMGNTKPSLSINTININAGQTRRLFNDFLAKYQHLIDYKDGRQERVKTIDGNRIAMKYEVRDTTGEQNFYLNTSKVDASSGYIFYPAHNTEDIKIKGDASRSSQTMQIRASDGKDWSDWVSFTVNTVAPNNAPVIGSIADQTVKVGITKNISSLVKATDSDGDTVTKYKVRDQAGGNSFYVSGSLVDASGSNGYEFNASALSTLSVKGETSLDSAYRNSTLQIAAYDGYAWGD